MGRRKINIPKATIKAAWKQGNQRLSPAADAMGVSPATARRLLLEAGCIRAGEKLKRGQPSTCPPSPGKRKLKKAFKEAGFRKNATAEMFGVSLKHLDVWLDEHDMQP